MSAKTFARKVRNSVRAARKGMATAKLQELTGHSGLGDSAFLLYGLAPVALVIYLMATPARRRAIKEREAQAQEAARRAAAEAAASDLPDQRSETPADAVAPVRKEP